MPEAIVKEMALFGRRISAERAHQIGFAAFVADDALAAALEVAGELTATSPRANEIAKAMIHGAVGEDRGAALETLGSVAAAESADRDEGVAAFLEKRTPQFRGK